MHAVGSEKDLSTFSEVPTR